MLIEVRSDREFALLGRLEWPGLGIAPRAGLVIQYVVGRRTTVTYVRGEPVELWRRVIELPVAACVRDLDVGEPGVAFVARVDQYERLLDVEAFRAAG